MHRSVAQCAIDIDNDVKAAGGLPFGSTIGKNIMMADEE
jgi:hypothetical protein